MEFLTDLWLPIVVAAVFVFVASSISHMVLQLHNKDCAKLENEGPVLDAIRSAGVPPGEYFFPGCEGMKEMGTPEMMEKYKQGPVGFMTVFPPGPPAIGKSLAQWFVYSLIIGAFVAYVADFSLMPGTDYLAVFRLTGTVAFLAYGIASIPGSIWKGVAWSTTGKFIFDGLVYGLVTGGAFGWLWPAAI